MHRRTEISTPRAFAAAITCARTRRFGDELRIGSTVKSGSISIGHTINSSMYKHMLQAKCSSIHTLVRGAREVLRAPGSGVLLACRRNTQNISYGQTPCTKEHETLTQGRSETALVKKNKHLSCGGIALIELDAHSLTRNGVVASTKPGNSATASETTKLTPCPHTEYGA